MTAAQKLIELGPEGLTLSEIVQATKESQAMLKQSAEYKLETLTAAELQTLVLLLDKCKA
jgi:hypothetical protein